jgi:DNA-binding MarR family transcriptional regulator
MQAAFTESLQELIGDSSTTFPQVLLLTQLYIHGTLNQQDLDRYTLVKKSANSRNVEKYRQEGWLESYEDLLDRRSKLVRLTPQGRALLETAAQKAVLLV